MLFLTEHIMHTVTKYGMVLLTCFIKLQKIEEQNSTGLSLDDEMTVEEAVTMYRVITGACRQGSETFVKSLGKLKEKYTVREIIEITKGQYNADKFSEYFYGI